MGRKRDIIISISKRRSSEPLISPHIVPFDVMQHCKAYIPPGVFFVLRWQLK